MKLVTYHESYSAMMFRRMKPLVWFELGTVILLVILFWTSLAFSFSRYYSWVILLILLGIFLFFKKDFDIDINDARHYREGQEGEDEVVKVLENTLDDNYTYIRNCIIPNTRIGDIDGLLIGPKGVFAIEVKNYTGVFRISGGDMYRKLKGDIYKLYYRNPFRQVTQQKNYLEKYLKEKGVPVVAQPIVVLVGGSISAIIGETKVFICEDTKLTNVLFKMRPNSEWNPQLANQIIKALNILPIPLPASDDLKRI